VLEQVRVPREAPPRETRAETTRHGVVAVVVLGCLVGLSALLRFVAGLAVPSPWYMPDEVIYGELGRSLFREGRFEILGGTPDFYGVVYPALVGLPLAVLDPDRAYVLLKALQAAVMSLAAVPVYLWGRSLMSSRWALVAAALTLALPGLAFTGFLMTEVAFYPVLVLTAWAMARALVRPTLGRQATVVAAVLVATMTRLQAIVLVPAFALAVALDAALARTWLRGLRRFLPAAAGFAAVAVLWIAVTLLGGGGALGAYSVTGEATYGAWDAVRFTLYHAADLLLLTAVVPVVAVVLLAVEAARGRERAPEARAYLAVTAAIALVSVAAVGVFASRWLGRLAERNLIALAPLLFLGFALWLDRGAPRPRFATLAAGVAAVGLLAFVPWDDFVTRAAQPDAFSIIPLEWLRLTYPDLDPRLVVVVAALELVALLALLPRRATWALPATVLALLVAASIPVSIEVAEESEAFAAATTGSDRRWIDRAADGPVAYLNGGEKPWSAGAPVWINLFWNRDVERVYNLFDAHVAGPVPRGAVWPAPDGRLRGPRGRPVDAGHVVASTRMTFVGERVGVSDAKLALWRLVPPLRLSSRTTGLDPSGVIASTGSLVVYDCRGGELLVSLRSPADQTVQIRQGDELVRSVPLEVAVPWTGRIPAAAPAGPGPRTCRFTVEVEKPLRAERLDFVRAA
jgi:hypothetical protein